MATGPSGSSHPGDSAQANGWSHVKRTVRDGVIDAPLEPILHPSRWRLRWIGIFLCLGHPLFNVLWTYVLPQHWESLGLRLLLAACAVPLIGGLGELPLDSRRVKLAFNVFCWVQLPVFFGWMYLVNCGNTVWLASMVAAVFIYYHAVDWRLATIGLITGWLVAFILFLIFGPEVPPWTAEHAQTDLVVVAFAWTTAVTLGFSSANLRRVHLTDTLATMGIMAHELRTPLATVSLVGEALVNLEAARPADAPPLGLKPLSQRLQNVVRLMNRQIDTQIINARLLRLPDHDESITASELVRQCVAQYPWRSERDAKAVVIQIDEDFRFSGSPELFAQVIDNLMKNALKSLASKGQAAKPGDLTLRVATTGRRGRIEVIDQGKGIALTVQRQLFEPFFSTDRGSGHGLGLAFCKRVVQGARGSIRVKSEPGKGATFTIDLPRQA